MKSLPFRVPRHLLPAQPVGTGASSLGVSSPFNDTTWTSPVRRASCPTSLRFRSQAFSTSQRFPSKSRLRGLVSCPNRSWASPLESFPHRDRELLSEPLAPLQLSTDLRKRTPRDLSRPVSPTSTSHYRTRQPGSPGRYELPFHGRNRFPVTLDGASCDRSLQPASPTSKRCSLCESVRLAGSFPPPKRRYSCELLLL